MKGKSLLAACLIVPLTALSLFVYLYANHGKLEIDHFGFFRVHDNHLVTQFGNHLVWLDPDGREQKTLHLQNLNIIPHGDFDFFSNGDLLVYNLESEPGLLDLLGRLLRLQKHESSLTRPAFTSQSRDGFYRCDLQRETCTAFAAQLPLLNSSFRLVIDRSTDEVYLADTPAFELYKLNSAGETLATSNTQTFKFPNQMVLAGDHLWLADTNHHRLVAVSTASDNFAQVQQEFAARAGGGYRWPHQIAQSDSGWWVNIGNNNLANGRILHFPYSAESPGENAAESPVEPDAELELSGMSDPMALAYWQGALWLADFDEPILQRYSAAGDILEPKQSATLASVTAQSQADYQYYQWLGYGGLGGLALVLLGGFGAAWVLERRQTIDKFNQLKDGGLTAAVNRPAKQPGGSEIFWLTNNAQRYVRWVGVIFLALVVAMVVSVIFLVTEAEKDVPGFHVAALGLSVALLLATAAAYWMFLHIAKLKLGVIGGSVVMQGSSGRRTIARGAGICYTRTRLMADDIIISLGNHQQTLFDRKQLEDYVFPRLKEARKCGQLEMLKYMWQTRDPLLVATLIILIIIAGMYWFTMASTGGS